MIIYNVTIKPNSEIASEWLQWLKDIHIPEVIATTCFSEASILHLLEQDETDGPTYAIQYKAASKADYNRYVSLHASKLRDKSFDRWGNKFIAIRSVMQVVQ